MYTPIKATAQAVTDEGQQIVAVFSNSWQSLDNEDTGKLP